MTKIFISYRRDDTMGHAGRIHERLASVFGTHRVFMDLDDISPGTDFTRAIEDSVGTSDAMIVLIGKQWLGLKDAAGKRRIDDPADFVHTEIASALKRNLRIIPVLLDHISMPSEKDLPDEIRQLARFQAIAVSEERWDYDMGQLVKALPSKTMFQGRRSFFAAAIVILVAVLAAIITMRFSREPAPDFAGRWRADVKYDFGDTHSEVFVFRVDNGVLRGSASFLGVDRGIVDGKVEGTRVVFATRSQELLGDQNRETRHHYSGTIESGAIRFTMQTDSSFSDHPPIEFTANREKGPTPPESQR